MSVCLLLFVYYSFFHAAFRADAQLPAGLAFVCGRSGFLSHPFSLVSPNWGDFYSLVTLMFLQKIRDFFKIYNNLSSSRKFLLNYV